MHEHLRQRFRPARLLTAATALAAAAAIAACGSSAPTGSTRPTRTSSPTGSSASTGSGSNPTSSTLAFSKCMRANGVPNFPDLSNKGMKIEANGQSVSVQGISVSAPAFAAARQTCQRYLPPQQATPAQAAQQRRGGLQFAKCMREHGVPNFPDPKVVSSQGGNQEVYLPGINLQAPAVQAGAKACGFGPKGP
jgi:hypothetical protein